MKKFTLFALSLLMVTAAVAQPDASFKGDNPSTNPKSQAWIEGAVTLWDNGLPDGVNGFSNATDVPFGARRTLLEDFVVPAGDIWGVENYTWRHVWGDPGLPIPSGTGLELQFLGNAGGNPDFGTVVAMASVNTYMEVATGDIFFSRPEAESFAEFDPITLTEGTYWTEMTIVGPDNNFQLTSPNIGNDCWVNYDDLGTTSCSAQFGGGPYGLSFRLGGTIVPVELQSVDIE